MQSSFEKWLDGMAKGTHGHVSRLLCRFFDFCGVDPDVAVEWQRGHLNDYRFVDLAYKWLEQNGGLRVSTKRTRLSLVRGFFLANRAPLPKDKHRFHSEKAPVLGELSVDEFRKILHSCNLTYRAALMMQFQSAQGVRELLYINTNLAEYVFEEVQKGSRLIRLNFPGRKANFNKRPYYSFIGGDAIDCLRQLFHSRGWKKEKCLFLNEYGRPLAAQALQTYFREHAIRVGVVKRRTFPCLECGGETVKRVHPRRDYKTYYLCTACGVEHTFRDYGLSPFEIGGIRYRMRPHELRDLFRTQWHYAQRYVGVDGDCAEFFMGHEIDPLKYDKIMRDMDGATAEYRKALPFLNILSGDARRVERGAVDERFEEMRERVEGLEQALKDVRVLLEK